jgi:predicted  nucleic acid-binding Zn-ribbon protein
VSKALEQLDAASREAAAAKQRAEQLEHELARTQQQAQSAQAQIDR